MLAQCLNYMRFEVRTTKWKCRKLCCIRIVFYSFVCHIIVVFNMILILSPIMLTGLFPILLLINNTILHDGSESNIEIPLQDLCCLFL